MSIKFPHFLRYFDKDFVLYDLRRALNSYLNALSDYKSSYLTISSYVAAFRRMAEYRCRKILDKLCAKNEKGDEKDMTGLISVLPLSTDD